MWPLATGLTEEQGLDMYEVWDAQGTDWQELGEGSTSRALGGQDLLTLQQGLELGLRGC